MNLYRLLQPISRLELIPLGRGLVDLYIESSGRRAGSLQLSRDDALALITILTASDPIGEIDTSGEVHYFTNQRPEVVIDEIGRIYVLGEVE
jgi:hypothetical protein